MDYAMNTQYLQNKQRPTQKPDWLKWRFMSDYHGISHYCLVRFFITNLKNI
ncbi:hypothetical protein A6R68_21664 [Neotoma lepida]|uniref:Uncharacterized protein n=1 Tax=Neotoma lepida TaxID=56216 RepID=A0A1A6HQ61_NEOLE|nr:hypothetical protein A6R68_21664 [Neotoma lepida]